jgi:hypothetical protein
VNSVRFWTLILASVAFLAGLGSGMLFAEKAHRQAQLAGTFGEFERAFVQEFQLDLERQQLLAQALDHYNRETQAIEDRYAAEYHIRMEPELRAAGLEYRTLIREQLLPEDQRPKFDRLMAPHVTNL